jgi:4-hydroxybenzoyl-CoA reductase subunit beta
MLRLKPIEVVQPLTSAEATTLLAEQEKPCRLIAGGTDLLPNLKLGYGRPEVLVALRKIEALSSVEVQGNELQIGAGTSLREVATNELVLEHVPVLAAAIGKIASPQIRTMGTIGGNICLDTRCRYINQSELFREALGGCLKSGSNQCHVVPGGTNCVAALSSDSVPVLTALGACIDILGPEGARNTALVKLYRNAGDNHLKLRLGELITTIRVPIPSEHTKLAHCKWAVRKSIDFPLVSVAVRLDLSETQPEVVEGGSIVVGVMGPQPKVIGLTKLRGRRLDASLAEEMGELAFKRCRTLSNVPYDPSYRRRRLAVEVKRAVQSFCTRSKP